MTSQEHDAPEIDFEKLRERYARIGSRIARADERWVIPQAAPLKHDRLS